MGVGPAKAFAIIASVLALTGAPAGARLGLIWLGGGGAISTCLWGGAVGGDTAGGVRLWADAAERVGSVLSAAGSCRMAGAMQNKQNENNDCDEDGYGYDDDDCNDGDDGDDVDEDEHEHEHGHGYG